MRKLGSEASNAIHGLMFRWTHSTKYLMGSNESWKVWFK